jgi:hypothetical protein
MSTVDRSEPRFTTTDAVAGFLAAFSVVLSGLSISMGFVLGLDAHPARLVPIAAILSIVAAVMSERYRPMAYKAMMFSAVAWVVGMTLAVIVEAPLF